MLKPLINPKINLKNTKSESNLNHHRSDSALLSNANKPTPNLNTESSCTSLSAAIKTNDVVGESSSTNDDAVFEKPTTTTTTTTRPLAQSRQESVGEFFFMEEDRLNSEPSTPTLQQQQTPLIFPNTAAMNLGSSKGTKRSISTPNELDIVQSKRLKEAELSTESSVKKDDLLLDSLPNVDSTSNHVSSNVTAPQQQSASSLIKSPPPLAVVKNTIRVNISCNDKK